MYRYNYTGGIIKSHNFWSILILWIFSPAGKWFSIFLWLFSLYVRWRRNVFWEFYKMIEMIHWTLERLVEKSRYKDKNYSPRQLSDTFRTSVLKSVQSFSGSSKSSGSPRSSRLYSWATLSSRRRRTSSRTWLDGVIVRGLRRIFGVVTRNLWSLPANLALWKSL